MASPVDSARINTNIATAATSHNINVGSPVAGTLLIVAVRFAGDPGTVTFTGYTPLVALEQSDATDDRTSIYYRWADGTEGASDVLSNTTTQKLAAICWEITGAADPALQAPTITAAAIGTTTANTANPGSRSVPASADFLFLALMGLDGEGNAPTLAPTNYSSLITANSGTGGAVATNCSLGGASRQLTTGVSEDPGVFTHPAATTGWTAYTLLVYPAFAVVEQEAYRFRNDDGDETTATWLAAADTAATIPLETPFRLRFALENQSAFAAQAYGYRIQYRLKPSGGAFGSWTNMTGITPAEIALSANFAGSVATTQQISSGTFAAGVLAENTAAATPAALAASTKTEIEFVLQAVAAQGAANDDTYEFRLTWNITAAVLNTYTQTPSLLIGTAGTPHTASPADSITLSDNASPVLVAGPGPTFRRQRKASRFLVNR